MARNMANWTPEEKAQFAEHLLRHAAIYEQVTGATSEAGRALESFKIGASSKAYHQTIHRLTAASGRGKANVDEVARMIVDLHKPGRRAGRHQPLCGKRRSQPPRPTCCSSYSITRSSRRPRRTQSTRSAIPASMAMSVPEFGLASLLGKLRGGPDRIHASEVGGYVDGLTAWRSPGHGSLRGRGEDGRGGRRGNQVRRCQASGDPRSGR
jgi:hypothetical protein